MRPQDCRHYFSDDAARSAVDQILRFQHSFAALPVAGVEERVKALSALCMGLDAIDDVYIHRVEWPAGSIGRDSDAKGVASSPELFDVNASREDLLQQQAVSSRSIAKDPCVERVMANPVVSDMRARMTAIYCVPLMIAGRVIGVLCAGTLDPGGFQAGIRLALDLLAPQLALSIENAWLESPSNSLAAVSQDAVSTRPPVGGVASAEDLVARLAHDIKNPLTTISTFMQLFSTKWNEEHFRSTFFPVVLEETERICRLVNDMLDRGKKQSAKWRSVDIQELVENLVLMVAPLAEQRQLRLSTHFALASSRVRLDERRINEAVYNILMNAIEATPDAGDIDIRLDSLLLPGGRPAIRIEIQDSGSGVDEAIQAEIFDPYISTKDDRHLSGGTGLGLNIARRNIQAHGGAIEFENTDASGALFRVILPVERRQW